jgi:hypothetical protein
VRVDQLREFREDAYRLASTSGQLRVNRTTAKVSTLIELLSWRALQQPEQRIFTYLADGEVEGAHLTYEALDSQSRGYWCATAKLWSEWGACVAALSSRSRVHPRLFWMSIRRMNKNPFTEV